MIVQTSIDEKDAQIESLMKMKVEQFQVGNQFAMLQKLLEQKHKQEIAKLEAVLLDKELEIELQKADNELMAAQLEDKEDISSDDELDELDDGDDDDEAFIIHSGTGDDMISDIEPF